MEKLLEMLEEINPGLNYETEDQLIDGGRLESLSILSLVSEIEDAFDVQITPADLVPANFNSAQAMWDMIQRLQEEE